jgi:hypothetical protein
VFPRVAVATALKAQEQGFARLPTPRAELYRDATRIIRQARDIVAILTREGLVPVQSMPV